MVPSKAPWRCSETSTALGGKRVLGGGVLGPALLDKIFGAVGSSRFGGASGTRLDALGSLIL